MIKKSLSEAVNLLQTGHVVAIPTNTVYGLAAHAYDQTAIEKIFKIKGRPTYDPLIVHIHGIDQLVEFAQTTPFEAVNRLIEAHWPGPLTLLFERKPGKLPDLVTAGLSTVAVRMPAHPMTRALLKRLGAPLVAPSANPFGYISPTTPKHVQDQLGDQVPLILDGGRCGIGIESTIVGFDAVGKGVLYRPGGITKERIEALLGTSLAVHKSDSARPHRAPAPGTLTQHYAPKTPFLLVKKDAGVPLALTPHSKNTGGLFFSDYCPWLPKENQKILSQSANLEEAARNLFQFMRSMDKAGYPLIVAERVPNQGLGVAINDRLQRAAAGTTNGAEVTTN